MTSDTLADTLQSVSQSQSAWPTVLAVLCVIMACLAVYNAENAVDNIDRLKRRIQNDF